VETCWYCLDRSGICQHWIESQVLLFLETPFAYLSTLRFSFSVIEAQKRKEGLFVIKKKGWKILVGFGCLR
jgi:hypothetical protein